MNFKFKIKSIILWERITGRPFSITNTEDIYIYFFCVLCTNEENYSKDFDEFLTECDENPEMMADFIHQLEEHNKRQKNLEK